MTTPTQNDVQQEYQHYYVPAQSAWPIVGAIALFFIAVGAGSTVADLFGGNGPYILFAGIGVLIIMLVGWFRDVIRDPSAGFIQTRWIARFGRE